jgi:hypothetical protein
MFQLELCFLVAWVVLLVVVSSSTGLDYNWTIINQPFSVVQPNSLLGLFPFNSDYQNAASVELLTDTRR